ncbi:HAD-IB family hydrolase [SAR202 cluster bacterium AD-802-E10_MRT_200m]|nr:HAD-IB family hydrolase [SAR202 cluster bacterium AD-802-E10_MRT_200m]
MCGGIDLSETTSITSSNQGITAAFFDVDGTLASSNLVYVYLDFCSYNLRFPRKQLWITSILPKLIYYGCVDLCSRAYFNEIFYKNYRGVSLQEMERWARNAVERYWKPRMFPQALEKIEEHRALGHRIILVSGGLALTLEPLARWLAVDACAAAWAEIDKDCLTGRLPKGALSGEAKVVATHEVAETLGLDLSISYGYADNFADRQFLGCLGNPVAVNPDRRLKRLANQNGWPIQSWGR